MKKVNVKYRGKLASLTGVTEEAVEAANVGDVLKAIKRNHGREAEKAARVMLIALNGESILLIKGYKTALKDGDTVSFFPICAGG